MEFGDAGGTSSIGGQRRQAVLRASGKASAGRRPHWRFLCVGGSLASLRLQEFRGLQVAYPTRAGHALTYAFVCIISAMLALLSVKQGAVFQPSILCNGMLRVIFQRTRGVCGKISKSNTGGRRPFMRRNRAIAGFECEKVAFFVGSVLEFDWAELLAIRGGCCQCEQKEQGRETLHLPAHATFCEVRRLSLKSITRALQRSC